MSAPVFIAKEKAEFYPVNLPSDGVFSFAGGYPIMQFQLANQDKHLDVSTLRLNGTLSLLQPDGVSKPENESGGAAAGNGIALHHRLGVASCLQQITIATSQNQTLESVRSYGRYLVSAMSVTHSPEDYDSVLTVSDPSVSSRSYQGAHSCNEAVSFSIPLRTGLLSGSQPLPLGDNGFRGMNISIELSPDRNAISGYFTYDADGTPTQQLFNPIGTGATYELSDISITCDLLIPEEGKSGPASGSIMYNSISHLYGILNSSDETKTYNLGASGVVSVFHNFLPTTYINNYSEDGFATPGLKTGGGAYPDEAHINKVSFLRGGSLFPLDYQIDVEDAADEERCQSEAQMRFMDSIKPFHTLTHSLVAPITQDGTSVEPKSGLATQVQFDTDVTSDPVPEPAKYYVQQEPQQCAGLGIRMDPLSKQGVDFKGVSYGLRVESDLDGQSPNSLFTYVVQKQVLSYSPSGITVSS